MENIIKQIKKIVENNYKPHRCGWTYERSEGYPSDCFDDGYNCGQSWLAYEIGMILGMDLEEPEESEED